jgi:Immunity protein Imm1
MILSAEIHGQYRQVATAHDVELLISEFMMTLTAGNPWVNMDCGETGELYFADSALTAETFAEPPFEWQPDSVLTVSINRSTGYGALRWNMKVASSNATPPKDPRVVYDPEVPYWFHPRHVLPLAQIDAAVSEFCHGDGEIPASVDWVDFNRAAGSYVDSDQYRTLFPKAA